MFIKRLGEVFEHSPWVAERAWQKRPFASLQNLHEAMVQAMYSATPDEQLALVRAHPELAGSEAREGTLTVESSSEQARLGFTRLTSREFARMAELNKAYRERFGFPCIVALRRHASREAVIAEMEQRAGNAPEVELGNALGEIAHITRGRLDKLFGGQ